MWIGVEGAHELPATYAACVNDDTVADSYDDTCSEWYDERPETCGDYDTDSFSASSSCCACKWDVINTDATTFDPDTFQSLLRANFAVLFTKDNC